MATGAHGSPTQEASDDQLLVLDPIPTTRSPPNPSPATAGIATPPAAPAEQVRRAKIDVVQKLDKGSGGGRVLGTLRCD